MLGKDLLIFPDTGDEFLRTLRTAALYAGRAYCLTYVGVPDRNEKFGSIMRKFRLKGKHLGEHQEYALKRLESYGEFLRANNSELVTAKEAGVLLPMSHATLEGLLGSMEVALGQFRDLSVNERMWAPLASKLARAADICPPSFFDMELLLPNLPVADFDLARQCLFLKYSLALMEMAEARALTLTSWSPTFRRFIWDLHKLLGAPESALRLRSEARLGQVVFERRLPRVDDLPLEEILAIRERRNDELEAFRTGLAELAAMVDTSQTHDLVERQIRDAVSTRIDPAVRELRGAIAASRLDSLKRVLRRSWTVMAAKATLPAVLSYLGTGRIELGAAAAAFSAVLLPLAEASLEKRKLLTKSPWSLLLRLK
jgi:hypothetical protein